jgi:hypothetical protein
MAKLVEDAQTGKAPAQRLAEAAARSIAAQVGNRSGIPAANLARKSLHHYDFQFQPVGSRSPPRRPGPLVLMRRPAPTPVKTQVTAAACTLHDLTLLSCTAESPPGRGQPLVSPDEVDGYFMDPWHRAKYGWAGPDRTIALTGTGSEVLVPVGVAAPGIFGTFETLTLTVANNEATTFEARLRSASPYEDGLSAEGILAWYRSINSYGNPAKIPSLLNPTKTGPTSHSRPLFAYSTPMSR